MEVLEVASGLRVPVGDIRRVWLTATTTGTPGYELWVAAAHWEEGPVVASDKGAVFERRMEEKSLVAASFPIDKPYAAAIALARLADLARDLGQVTRVWKVTPEGMLDSRDEVATRGAHS